MPPREEGMRDGKAEAGADVDARIAQIGLMTLEQIAAFQGMIQADITKGKIAPKEVSALNRALRKRLMVIEQELRLASC